MDTELENEKYVKGAWPRSRDLLFTFWDHANISGTAEVTNMKFSMQIDLKGH